MNPAPVPLLVSGLLTRLREERTEVFLAPFPDESSQVYALPARELGWGEDAREVLRQLFAEFGLRVEIGAPYELRSNVDDPASPALELWFRARLEGGDPQGAGRFVGLEALPPLARATDQLVLWQLAREQSEGDDPPPQHRDAAQASQRQLVDAYTKELMRGAWVNQLHMRLAGETDAGGIATATAAHLAKRAELARVRIWFPGPGDRCSECPWRDPCAHDRCLHLVAHEGAEVSRQERRIPLLPGYLPEAPAADVALRDASQRVPLEEYAFHGFPLHLGEELPGVLGLFSREQLVAQGLYEAMASHVGNLVRSARMVQRLIVADQAKHSFITRLSHEFKTPLQVILGFAEMLKEEPPEGDDGSLGMVAGESIYSSGEQLLKIVDSMLELAKLESAATALEPERLDLSALLAEALEQAGVLHNLQKGLALALELPPEPLYVWADHSRVDEILGYLLHNAIKFTRRGSVTVSLERQGDEAVCRIKDTGIGIAASEQEKIFQAFYQISEEIHTEFGGIGLGLAISEALVRAHGGRIWVESQPDMGSSFFFTLPCGARVT